MTKTEHFVDLISMTGKIPCLWTLTIFVFQKIEASHVNICRFERFKYFSNDDDIRSFGSVTSCRKIFNLPVTKSSF